MGINLRFGKPRGLVLALAGLLFVVALALSACSWASSDQKATVVQVPQSSTGGAGLATGGAAPTSSAAATGWETEAAKKVGIKLLQTFDPSGPAAWDVQKHPLVFFTSDGPGYGGLLSSKVKFPGLAVIDATTKEVITARWFDLGYGLAQANDDMVAASEPHSLGVSADGKMLYLPAVDPTQPADDRGRLLVINARTLKLQQVIGTQRAPHHSKALTPPRWKKPAIGLRLWRLGHLHSGYE